MISADTTAPCRSHGLRTAAVAACLFTSGFCALVYQTVWLREFRLFFGTSTAATAAVTTLFMGGLGVGSVVLGRRAERHARPLAFYAGLEFLIALAAALTPALLWGARQAYLALGGTQALGMFWGTLLRLGLSALVLLAPTLLLGGTLPAAVKALQREGDPRRRWAGAIYGLNTLGAVSGVVLSTFVLIESWGHRGTLLAACALNLAVAAIARAASRGTGAGAQDQPRPGPRELSPDAEAGVAAAAARSMVLAVAAVAGFVFFAMELVWYRMLAPLLGGSTFTFGVILAVALGGTALGSLAYAVTGPTRRVTRAGLAVVCGLEALFLAAPFALGDWLAMLAVALQPVCLLGQAGRIIVWTLVSGAVVFPAAFCAGALFPMLIALLGGGRTGVASQTGLVYGWNTAGAVIGMLAAGFGLLPGLTAPGVWRAMIVVLALAALTALFWRGRDLLAWRRRLLPLAIAGAALWLVTFQGPTAAWRHSPIGAGRVKTQGWSLNDYRQYIHSRRRDLEWEAEGRESSLGLMRNEGYAILVNGKSDGNARLDAGTQVMLGLLGAMIHPHPARSLVIGLGTGSSAGWLADVPTMERVDVVELEPAMARAARFCAPVNRHALDHPRLRLHLADAREFIQTTREQYDLIASEPSNPYRAGVASLFTREFYQAAARRLRPGGLFVQWVQAYEIDGAALRTIYATLTAVFPEVDTWRSQSGDLLLVCSRAPLDYDIAALMARGGQEPYRSALAAVWRIMDVEGLFARFVADARFARVITAPEPRPNTDDCNRLEFSFARSLGGDAGFNLDALTRLARAQGYGPRLRNGALELEAFADRCASARLLDSGAELLPLDSPGYRARAAAKEAYAVGDFAAVCRLWKSQPRAPGDLTELFILALSLARQKDPLAVAHIEQLRQWHPGEADAVQAQYLCLTGRLDEGLALLEKVFHRWETDPWAVLEAVRSSMVFAKAAALGAPTPDTARRVFHMLQRPLAVRILEKDRTEALLELARHLHQKGLGAEVIEWIKAQEPHVPWTRPFLELRAAIYQLAADPRHGAAQRDLDRFDRATSRPLFTNLPPAGPLPHPASNNDAPAAPE
jgi:spermidine synthase